MLFRIKPRAPRLAARKAGSVDNRGYAGWISRWDSYRKSRSTGYCSFRLNRKQRKHFREAIRKHLLLGERANVLSAVKSTAPSVQRVVDAANMQDHMTNESDFTRAHQVLDNLRTS